LGSLAVAIGQCPVGLLADEEEEKEEKKEKEAEEITHSLLDCNIAIPAIVGH